MTKIFENYCGMYLLHEKYINDIYHSIKNDSKVSYNINPNLFAIYTPYKNSKSKRLKAKSDLEKFVEQENIKLEFHNFVLNDFMQNLFETNKQFSNNSRAIETADYLQKICSKSQSSISDLAGGNIGPAVIKEINGSKFFFPENSKFFAKDVSEINKYLENQKYDFILLDPPWWNKYIRRKRKVSSVAYKMMYNEDLKNIPIGDLLAEDGLIAVWCTNSEQHMNALLNDIFPKWDVEFSAKWYWVKVTKSGEPICNFSEPPGKQPYEKLIFGHRKRALALPKDGKLLISIPSAIHSHKPPLIEALEEFLPKNPQCLEVFARYLLPNWTSYGNEVLMLQHECLFV